MPRLRPNAGLGSRESRSALKRRAEPYWHQIEKGLFLGYRKSAKEGAWVARRYNPDTRKYSEERLGSSDDYQDADGIQVLSFAEAQRAAMAESTRATLQGAGALYTVDEAVEDYVEFLTLQRKSSGDAELKLKAYLGPLAGKRLAELEQDDFSGWLKWALRRKRRHRARTRPIPKKRRKRPEAHAEDAPKPADAPAKPDANELLRRRKATLNRVIGQLKACLNLALKSGKGPAGEWRSNPPWRDLRKFKAVDSARLRWLTVSEATRLQNAVRPDLRPMVQAALLTGCRAGELLKAKARDFDPHSKTLLVPDSKSGKPRRVPLTDEGAGLFETLTAGLESDALIFTRAGGEAWYGIAIGRAMQEACGVAKISPPATFHTLRHTYASHLAQNSVPLLFIASALGHRDTRMVEKHYGHLAPSHVADAIRANLPSFGVKTAKKVKALRPK